MHSLSAAARALWSTQRHLLLQFDLKAALPPLPQDLAAPGILFRVATRDEVEGMEQDPRHEISAAGRSAHRALLDAGSVCTLGWIDGLSVYHGWRSTNRWRIAGPREIPLPPGVSVVSRCFTVRAARGQGIYRAALAHELATLAGRGDSRALINVEMTNLISRRVIERAGFQPVGVYRVTRVAGYVMVFLPQELRSRCLTHS